MKRHEQWSDSKDKTKQKKNFTAFGKNVSVSYENRANNAPASALVVFIVFLAFGSLFFAVFSQIHGSQRQKEELSLADKAFLAGDYKAAEADYKKLLTELQEHDLKAKDRSTRKHFNATDMQESFTQEKLALTQIAQSNYAEAQKNLDTALDSHIQFIERSPVDSGSSDSQTLGRPDKEAKHVLRILNNKSQLLYLEKKNELVPTLLAETWDKVNELHHIQRRKSSIYRELVHAQAKSLKKRHLDSAAEALHTQLSEIKQLPKEERTDRYFAILKEQRPPANAQFSNCDFGVFGFQ